MDTSTAERWRAAVVHAVDWGQVEKRPGLALQALQCESSVDVLVQSRAMVQRAAPGIFHTVL